MIKRFRTKPVEINAIQFDGTNFEELAEWTKKWFIELDKECEHYDPTITASVYDKLHLTWIGVKPGQWIVKGVKGEFYPCDNETFFWKYEEVK